MASRKKQHIKHVPQRTCVGCRQVLAKRSLTRIVRTSEGVRVDSTGKLRGRGAYLHNIRACWETGLKGPLAHALKTEMTGQDLEGLMDYFQKLPVPEPEKQDIGD